MKAMQKAISQLQKKCKPIKDEDDFDYYATNNIVWAMDIAIKEAEQDKAKKIFDEIDERTNELGMYHLIREIIRPVKRKHLK